VTGYGDSVDKPSFIGPVCGEPRKDEPVMDDQYCQL
jgi:hypothetical protein